MSWQTNLQDLRECLHDPRVFIAVRLHGVDKRDLRLGARTERLNDRREALRNAQMVQRYSKQVGVGQRTETSRRARPSI
jgi:hypothetical protein